MLEVGLTGGIGSGKSTVSAALAERGAEVIDADQIVRDLQVRGQPVFHAIVDHFGSRVLDPDGNLDRAAVATIVFADPDELAALNAIVHPAVAERIEQRREQLRSTDAVVVHDIPLLVSADGQRKGRYDHLAAIIVVDVDPEVAVQRLVRHRGFDADDARARMAHQASREARLAHADFVIDNNGSRNDLTGEIDACWRWLADLAARQS